MTDITPSCDFHPGRVAKVRVRTAGNVRLPDTVTTAGVHRGKCEHCPFCSRRLRAAFVPHTIGSGRAMSSFLRKRPSTANSTGIGQSSCVIPSCCYNPTPLTTRSEEAATHRRYEGPVRRCK